MAPSGASFFVPGVTEAFRPATINAVTVRYAVNNDGQVYPVPFASLPKEVAI
jgi:hypothetical protein